MYIHTMCVCVCIHLCVPSVYVSIHARVGACRGQRLISSIFYHCLLIFLRQSLLLILGSCHFTWIACQRVSRNCLVNCSRADYGWELPHPVLNVDAGDPNSGPRGLCPFSHLPRPKCLSCCKVILEFFIYLLYLKGLPFCLYAHLEHALCPGKIRRGHWLSWNLSDRWVWATR